MMVISKIISNTDCQRDSRATCGPFELFVHLAGKLNVLIDPLFTDGVVMKLGCVESTYPSSSFVFVASEFLNIVICGPDIQCLWLPLLYSNIMTINKPMSWFKTSNKIGGSANTHLKLNSVIGQVLSRVIWTGKERRDQKYSSLFKYSAYCIL
jgi:hypothetical protein